MAGALVAIVYSILNQYFPMSTVISDEFAVSAAAPPSLPPSLSTPSPSLLPSSPSPHLSSPLLASLLPPSYSALPPCHVTFCTTGQTLCDQAGPDMCLWESGFVEVRLCLAHCCEFLAAMVLP